MSDYITPIPRLIAQATTAAANRLVRLDEDYARKLRDLEGRKAQVTLRGTGLTFTVGVRDGQLHVSEIGDEEADVKLSGTPAAIFGMAAPSGGDYRRPNLGRVDVVGDAGVGQRFAECFKRLDIDWEEPIARAFGDVAGFQIAKFIRGSAKWGRNAARSFGQSLNEYLTEEARMVVGQNELDAFYDDVDDVRDAVDRLEKRIRRLEK